MQGADVPSSVALPEGDSPHNAAGSGMVTPMLLKLGSPAQLPMQSAWAPSPQQRSGSLPASARGLAVPPAAKTVQESAILTVVRRQMEALEDKLSGQIARVQQQGDRLRDAAFSRVDSKMGMVESLQPRLDRRIAELCGSYKGLSDEMQSQIRRIDHMDSRLWEWRHQLDEEIRTKFAELEQGIQQATSLHRVTKAANDDLMKRYNQRLLRLEGLVEERCAQAEEMSQSLVHFHNRLSEVEELRVQQEMVLSTRELQVQPVDYSGGADRAMLASVQGQMTDLLQRMDYWQQESHEQRTKIEAQEERCRSLRTMYEAKDEQYRAMAERIERENWDGRLKEIMSRLQEGDKARQEHAERLEIMLQRIDGQEQVSEELLSQLRRLQDRNMMGGMGGEGVMADNGEAAIAVDLQAAAEHGIVEMQLRELESRVDAISTAVESMRADMELAPRVAALVVQLKDVAPKVIHQEALVRQLSEKVDHVQAAQELDGGRAREVARSLESLEARIGRLDAEVNRLVNEVEGHDDVQEGSPAAGSPPTAASTVVATAVLNVLRRASSDGDPGLAGTLEAMQSGPDAAARRSRRASATE